MSCKPYQDALTEAADGGPVPADLEAHLAACARCRQELAALRSALALADASLSRLAVAEPSPALAPRIRRAVAASDGASAGGYRWLWPATAVAAALVVALAVGVGRGPAPVPHVAGVERPSAVPGETPVAAGPGSAPTAPEPAAPAGSGVAALPSPRLVGSGSAASSVGPRRGPASASAADVAPDVLVPRGETEALVRFAAIVHRGRHAPDAFLATGRPSTDLVEPVELDIKPLEIVPLDPAETAGT